MASVPITHPSATDAAAAAWRGVRRAAAPLALAALPLFAIQGAALFAAHVPDAATAAGYMNLVATAAFAAFASPGLAAAQHGRVGTARFMDLGHAGFRTGFPAAAAIAALSVALALSVGFLNGHAAALPKPLPLLLLLPLLLGALVAHFSLFVAVPAAASEGLSPLAAARRSLALMRGHRFYAWRAAVVMGIALIPLLLPAVISAWPTHGHRAAPDAASAWAWIAALCGVAATAVSIALPPTIHAILTGHAPIP